jgi:hypothetical protein
MSLFICARHPRFRGCQRLDDFAKLIQMRQLTRSVARRATNKPFRASGKFFPGDFL